MKKIFSALLLFISISVFAQNGDALIGTYMTDKNEGMVDIIKKGTKYYGTLTWTKTPGKLDANNPDKKPTEIAITAIFQSGLDVIVAVLDVVLIIKNETPRESTKSAFNNISKLPPIHSLVIEPKIVAGIPSIILHFTTCE